MRMTIVVDDNLVIIDGEGRHVDCSALAEAGQHALQWYGTWGEVEYRTTMNHEKRVFERLPNEIIDSLGPYEVYINQWNAVVPEPPPPGPPV